MQTRFKIIMLISLACILCVTPYLEAKENNIFNAIQYGNIKQVKNHLKQGMSINATDEDGDSLLHLAMLNKNLSLIEFLLNNGANVNLKNNDGDTIIMDICITGDVPSQQDKIKDIAQLLIKHDADINIKNNDGVSAKEICEMLSPQLLRFIQDIGQN